MFILLLDGEYIDEFETRQEAEKARDREILEACREDVLYGGYSKSRERSYYHRFTIEQTQTIRA